MRQLGSLSSLAAAERFADYLRADGVGCTVDACGEKYRIWVQDDDLVAAAKEELPRFIEEPDHERYAEGVRRAQAGIQQAQRQQKSARGLTVNVSEKWNGPAINSNDCLMTYGLIALSILVGFITSLNPKFNDPVVSQLYFSTNGTFQQILHGEPWRLVTPMFLHFNLMHIVFNMLWTYQFGVEIESRRGSARFLVMVLVIAALSNAAQFWVHGQLFRGRWYGDPHFGGMSGVVYGLFGYIWVKGRLDRSSGFDLPQQTVTMMLVWHVLCVVGVIPNVANWCHGIGLVTGIAIAVIDTFVPPLLRRR